MTSLLLLAALGQCHSYQQQYQGYGYNGYYQGYHYGYVAPQVIYKDAIVATVAPIDPYYAALVAARAQQEKAALAKAEASTQLATEVGGLRQELAGMRQALAGQAPPPQPQPQPRPINPVPPPAFAPAQPSPQQPPPEVPAKGYPQAYATPSPAYGPPGAGPTVSLVASPGAVGVDVLQRRCINCHAGSSAQKGFAIFDDDGKLAVRGLQWVKIEKRMAGDLPGLPQMPPRHPVPAEEFAAVRALVALHDADILADLSAKGP